LNQVGSLPIGGDFIEVPGEGPALVRNDPAHPYIANGAGVQPTYRIADLSNPNLRPWVKERMKKDNDEVLDNYRTPHGEKLHVTERWKLIEDGNMLEMSIKVEDPDTYYEPWSSAIQRFQRVQQQMREEVCAENNQHLFDYGIPVANNADF
jgi:hypothetical protein